MVDLGLEVGGISWSCRGIVLASQSRFPYAAFRRGFDGGSRSNTRVCSQTAFLRPAPELHLLKLFEVRFDATPLERFAVQAIEVPQIDIRPLADEDGDLVQRSRYLDVSAAAVDRLGVPGLDP